MPLQKVKSSRGRRLAAVTAAVVVVIVCLWLVHNRAAAPAQQAATAPTPQAPVDAGFDFSAHSLTDPSSIWVVVNKHRPLQPKNYVPTLTLPNVKLKSGKDNQSMLVSSLMAPSLQQLFAASSKSGNPLMLSSGYRSYAYQLAVYNSEVKGYGKTKADAESARPGYSEHQTGLAADVAPANGKCDVAQCFGATPAGKWLAANAYKYGFIIRYPAGQQAITGYEYEPWHIRYIGAAAATQMHIQGIKTLEDFFSLEPAPDYN